MNVNKRNDNADQQQQDLMEYWKNELNSFLYIICVHIQYLISK